MAKIRRYCRTVIVLYRQVTFDQIIGEFVDRPVRYRAPFVENTIAVRNTTRERQLLLNKQYRNAVIVIESYDDFTNFMNAVIDKAAFDSISEYIHHTKESPDAEIISGGDCDDTKGYFIQPTTILTTDPHFKTMQEEIFGPVLTVYLYDPSEWSKTIDLVDSTSPYGLTGCVIGQDKNAVSEATERLRHSAGNFYINDKPTGAVVGQQPFGGSRASGTNDKAGSDLNLLRWVSIRTIKKTFDSPKDYRYPFLEKD